MIVGSPFLSFVSDRVLRSRKKVLLICSVLMVFLTAVLAFFPGSMSLPLLYLFFFVLSLCSSSIVVIGFTSAKELFPVAIAGTSMGAINFFPFLGGAVMQPLFGWALVFKSPSGQPYPVADVYGRAFTLMFASAVIALICALLTEETLKKAD
ncbi:MAG: MFS transporter, partial [Pseudomonadota bacterium]